MDGKVDAGADMLLSMLDRARPLFELADALKAMGSVTQATSERNQAYEDAKAKHEGMLADVTEAERELTALRSAQEAERSAQDNAIRALMDDAERRVSGIISDAHKQAAALIAEAQGEADRVQTQNQQLIANGRGDLALLQSEAREAERARDNALAELRDVQAKIDTLREAAKSVLSQPDGA